MKSICMWKILFLYLWIHVGFMSGSHSETEIVSHLSKEDVLHLKDEKNPKCIAHTEDDFTCYFETTDNKTYDILYEHVGESTKRCEMSVWRTEEGHFLHICQFPSSDVYTFSKINIQVVEHTSNVHVCSWSTYVENHFLSDPPSSVVLTPNGNVGELQVSWHAEVMKYWREKTIYGIRYSPSSNGEQPKQVKETSSYNLELPPGEVAEVQVAIKVGNSYWSRWSQPVRAAVPQSADDISLTCHTSDLHKVVCQWKGQTYALGNEYKLFYITEHRESSLWSSWTECLPDGHFTDQCCFYGNESKEIKVKLSSPSAPLSRTFYSQQFMLNNIIKPSPPYHLKFAYKQEELCLQWEAPPSALQNVLQYEVEIQTKGNKQWTRIIGPETIICEQVPLSTQFMAKVRAKPNHSSYSGSWSDWSDELIDYTPPDLAFSGMLHMCAIIVPIFATISFCVLGLYHSKLQQYFWPPVPNLEKVLQGFLTEIIKEKWDVPVTAKECFEETTSSVVEIVSERAVFGLESLSEESSELLSLDGSLSSRELVTGSSGTEVFPDYVTLNKEIIIPCLEENSYVSELTSEKKDPEAGEECLQICNCSCFDSSPCVKSFLDYTNPSYLLITESTERFSCKVHGEKGPGNLYTNLPCS